MTDLGWYVIHGDDLKHLLTLANNGEDPDLLLAEWYANCDHTAVVVEDDE